MKPIGRVSFFLSLPDVNKLLVIVCVLFSFGYNWFWQNWFW